MTREENICQSCAHSKVCKFNDGESSEYCNQHLAITALRPVSREQVEKVWRGEWIIVYDEDKEITIATCSKCGDETAYGGSLKADDCDAFCPVCGAPMTDEAVQMVMERLEALYETT